MANTAAVILAYLVTILLILGGFFCLYVSLKMISKRAQSSGSPTNFTAEIGDHKISIGTGSLAALVLTISVLWAVVALLSKPRIEFAAGNGGTGLGVVKLISSVEVKPDRDVDDAVMAQLVARNKELTAIADNFGEIATANADANGAAEAAEAASIQAAEAAHEAAAAAAAAASAAEQAAANNERAGGG